MFGSLPTTGIKGNSARSAHRTVQINVVVYKKQKQMGFLEAMWTDKKKKNFIELPTATSTFQQTKNPTYLSIIRLTGKGHKLICITAL